MICFDLIGFYLEFLVKKYGAWLHKCMKSKSSNFDGVIMKNVFPNITGELNNTVWAIDKNTHGVFKTKATGNLILAGSSNSDKFGAWHLTFNANNSSVFFGRSSTVQVCSVRLFSIVRT